MTVQHKPALWFGVAAGPAAWVVSTELNYALARWQCMHAVNITLPASLILGLFALAAAFTSARTMRLVTGSGRLLAVIGSLLGLLSATIVFVQGAASVVLSACER